MYQYWVVVAEETLEEEERNNIHTKEVSAGSYMP